MISWGVEWYLPKWYHIWYHTWYHIMIWNLHFPYCTCLAAADPGCTHALPQQVTIVALQRRHSRSRDGRVGSLSRRRPRRIGLNTGLWYHMSYHSQYDICYWLWYHSHDIIVNIITYDIIVNIITYDIIVNIIPVISGTSHYHGPWPAFADQPYLSCIYIPIRCNWVISQPWASWDATRLVGKALDRLSEASW